ncbi:hypothetical protein JAAARDRAFT_75619 [Jaapia argillacea MUCL 33604]|uniref:Uncharacterized protein n=1 Tax=Jaapia argillacea MUCL 33604 TaxID=933084 RepID=A0A067QA55_9AGAM|nr:hypothetical protein JAAARDRAFT_75619 [Jaapia argillacea MUCL 33604]
MPNTMECRGRSRDISPIAIARRASEDSLRRSSSYSSRPPTLPQQSDYPSRQPQPREQLNPALRIHHPLSPTTITTCAPSSSRDASDSSASTSYSRSDSSTPTPPEPITPSSEYATSESDILSPIGCSAYYESPPSPPRSLEDQMQVAYALDDMHLARVLLLKLKGIEVTSSDDPRIAQVRDEDFSPVFAPEGVFALEEKDEKRLREGQKREKERWERRMREERLRECEKVWEEGKRVMREEKERLLRVKEVKELEEERWKVAKDVVGKETEERAQRERTRGKRISREVLSYGALDPSRPSSPPKDEPLFQYNLPLPPSPRHSPGSSPKARRRELAFQQSVNRAAARSVPFRSVLSSMQGPLFPPEPESTRSFSLDDLSKGRGKVDPQQADLLETLLQVVEWEDGERRRTKGKDVIRTPLFSKSGSAPCAQCSSCSVSISGLTLSSASTSTTATPISHSASWLSFGSRSSTSTALTSLASDAGSDDLKSQPAPLPTNLKPRCRCPSHDACHLVTVSLASCPLSASHDVSPTSNDTTPRGDTALETSIAVSGQLMKRVSRSVEAFVGMASKFQKAYVRATLFSVASPTGGLYEYARSVSSSRSRSRSSSSSRERSVVIRPARNDQPLSGKGTLKPSGYRVHSADVHIFISSPSKTSADLPGCRGSDTPMPYTLIPLTTPSQRSSSHQPRLCPPPSYITPSPLRPRYPPSSLEWRMRPIGNPVLLRLKALHNLCCRMQMPWEGKGREGMLGCGRERLVGVAWEGRMRSGLNVELRVGDVL